MIRFLVVRLLQSVPVLIGVSVIAWALTSLAPGDASTIYAAQFAESGRPTAEEIERAREDLGLDGTLPEQYAVWMSRVVRGDLGRSFQSGAPVVDELQRRAWPTIQLALVATVLTVVAGVGAGVVAALHQDRWQDHVARLLALAGGAVPSFWMSLVLIWFFAVKLDILPSLGRGGPSHLVLPAIALSLGGAGTYARLVRASMLDVLTQDYITAARAKGLAPRTVILRHALRNAMFPAVTQMGLTLGALLGGAAIIETIFAWPGMGKLAVDSIAAKDYPVIQSVVLVSAVTYVGVNVVVDVAYQVLDPRVLRQAWR